MRKITLLFIIFLIVTGCSYNEEPIIEEKIKEPVKEKYVDLNPIRLGFYDKSRKLIISSDCKWEKKKDILWPSVFPVVEENISNENSKTVWEKLWKDYIDKGYKFGYDIKYSLINGEDVELTILKPSDNKDNFKYVELYIYDGLNATTTWFDHLDDDELSEATVITSIKLTGGTNIDEVITPIILRVFTYDGNDDFDKEGKYIGNSYAEITVNKI